MISTEDDVADKKALRSSMLLLSALFGAAAAFLAFVLFLQTAAVSTARLLAVLLLLVVFWLGHYWISLRWFAGRLHAAGTTRLTGLGLLLVIIFFPLLYRPPAYPLSPLLRPWTDLAVQFEVPPGSGPLTLRPDSVRLIMGKEALNTTAFERVGPWHTSGLQLRLAPGDTGSLRWTGTVPDTIVLSIQPPTGAANLTIYWDGTRTGVQLHPGQQAPLLISQKADLPWGFNLAFLLSWFIVAAWAVAWISILVKEPNALLSFIETFRFPMWAGVLLCIVLAVLTVKLQLDSLNGGMQFLATTQLTRHSAILHGQSPDPWQYRVLSEYLVEGMIRLFRGVGMPAATNIAFISLRLLQNAAIFLVALTLYKKIGASEAFGLLGTLILTASMLNAFYDNDLSFNTYFDLLFYLLCIWLLLSRKYTAVVILTVFAALNRETSGLIPFVMQGAIYGDNTRSGFRKYMPVFLSLALYIGIFTGLRLVLPPRALYIPYRHAPGIPLLLYNLTRSFTWQQLLATLGLVPLLGLIAFPKWPPLWQRLLLLVCPVWFLIHSFGSIMAETRLFLVPQAIVFIPGVLFALRAWLNARGQPAIPSLEFERGAS